MHLQEYIQNNNPESRLVYVPNFGNAGDAIIALGTFEFFKDNNIRYRIDHRHDLFEGNNLFLAGGGAFIGAYPRPEATLKKAIDLASHVTILPHTIKKIPSHLKANSEKVTIFAREWRTYELLKEELPKSAIHMEHDMAFFLSDRICALNLDTSIGPRLKCLMEGTMKQRLRALKNIPKAIKNFNSVARAAAKAENLTLMCFRRDIEKTNRPIPENNFDISDLYKIGTETKATVQLGARMFISSLKKFNAIETDRLHCAITGAMLGKKVKFFSNNYFKNEAVYEYSIKQRFPNVEWMQ